MHSVEAIGSSDGVCILWGRLVVHYNTAQEIQVRGDDLPKNCHYERHNPGDESEPIVQVESFEDSESYCKPQTSDYSSRYEATPDGSLGDVI